MKRLALITPKGNYWNNKPTDSLDTFQTFTANDLLLPRHEYWSGGNLGLLIVAALTPLEFKIDFIDENYEEINFDAPHDLIGITAMTQQATRAYEIADEFRRRGIKVVIGGIHATVLPEEAKNHADAVVMGEAETVWPELIDDFVNGRIKHFYKSAEPVDLAKSPLPRYDLLKKYSYKMIWVQTTRGCPRDCEFCVASNVYGKKYRHKSVGQVLGEINYIRGLWNETIIHFADDNMFVDKVYSRELVMRLAQTELRWIAQADVSVAEDDQFLELLQNAGCKLLFIGFETLSKQGRLDSHGWKQSRIDRYPEIINKIQSYGIGIMGAFILGLDSDDLSIVDELSGFIVNNGLYAVQVTILTPLPGTKLRERLLSENRMLSSDWSKYTFEDVNFVPKNMSPRDLQRCLWEIYKRVYSKEARMSVIKHFKGIYLRRFEQNEK